MSSTPMPIRWTLLASTIALVIGTAQAQNLDLSSLPEEQHVPLVGDGNITVGVFRYHAADGHVLVGHVGSHDVVLSLNVGMFFGSPKTHYLGEIPCTIVKKQAEVDTSNPTLGPIRKYISDDRECKLSDVWWEGIVTAVANILNADGSGLGVTPVVTPRAGSIGRIKLGTQEPTITKSDITDGTLRTSDGSTYSVLFMASTGGQMCFLSVQGTHKTNNSKKQK